MAVPLAGIHTPASKFWEANAAADAVVDELAELRALSEKTPTTKQLAHKIASLVDTYLHHAADTDQRTQILNLANMLRYSTALCAAQGNEVHHYESEACDEWTRADGLQQKLDAAEANLDDAVERIRELEAELAQARSESATARAVGGVR
ncbi:Gp37 [Mycolicibacterium canariasense]|uniref:Gp37 n=2 Tax=Mycolicibacterium canariasense TaxID=228230 RepID=A0A117IC39_MYCCR|nr:Gp37 [Mycolicibacterium canariasense]